MRNAPLLSTVLRLFIFLRLPGDGNFNSFVCIFFRRKHFLEFFNQFITHAALDGSGLCISVFCNQDTAKAISIRISTMDPDTTKPGNILKLWKHLVEFWTKGKSYIIRS